MLDVFGSNCEGSDIILQGQLILRHQLTHTLAEPIPTIAVHIPALLHILTMFILILTMFILILTMFIRIPATLILTTRTIFCTPGQNPFPGLISSQPVSPWFPSIPAVACGGNLFSFTIQGKPHMDVKLVSDNSKQDQKKGLLALQIISANNGMIPTKNSVTGMIFQGASNIEHNKGHDFDVKTMFNDCQTLAFSK